MGRSRTSAYALEIHHQGCRSTPQCWWVKESGKPTPPNLAKYIEGVLSSLLPGGSNHHLTIAFGDGAKPVSALIRHNCTGGAVLASWKAS